LSCSFWYYQVLRLSSSAISSLVSAHPGQEEGVVTGGEPCPFRLGSPDQQGHQQFRALAERTGDGGIPPGGYQAVMADLRAIMTDSQDFWPGDFAGTPNGPHYGGYVPASRYFSHESLTDPNFFLFYWLFLVLLLLPTDSLSAWRGTAVVPIAKPMAGVGATAVASASIQKSVS
jgi:hypothetical protein